ncbi:4-hydroxy-3-methylbut-2-en-1-yl diphosphate synthase [Plasmodium yoelii 17X]|uniref:4-hydroxy-3-methylbut-2-en-1-yl diphosphate synthase (ferredoxin), chloroplastic n=1 Tax=Plasmodium yoelii 17X TaxID=1323249 RepID=V7PJ10_PLAYE|nr:4-hydroxy-3-methylbut-2-en-1-yl diphosphate synthase [Plasmodium yoelii 17X]
MGCVKRLILFIVGLYCYIEMKANILNHHSDISTIFVRAKNNDKKNMYQFLINDQSKRRSNNNVWEKGDYIGKSLHGKRKKKMNFNSLSSDENSDYESIKKIETDEDKYNLIKNIKKYCECTKRYKRLPTREVKIGNIKIGGNNRISIQTMTSCDTRNVEECVNQIKRCKDLGADLVRLTVQGVQEVEASYRIKDMLLSQNITIPLVADIHFNPKIALMAAEVYDKIRVNPGNYVDGRKKWVDKVYKKKEFEDGKLFIKEKFVPLIEKCKQLNRAIRIGTNHGSLSSRMLSYYGDTPLGMVESAFEFSDLCIENNFFNIVYSMKASNAYVMIQSYRLLVAKQYEKGNDIFFPIHLGVTEAGFGDNGRIKSYLGIGSLLYDGIGDTIRISLTEDPWEELHPCKKLIENLKKRIFYTDQQNSNYFTEQNKENNNATTNRNNRYTTLDFHNFNETFRNFNNIVKRQVVKKKNVLHEECTIGNAVTVKELEDSLQIFKDLNLELDKNGNLKKGAKTTDIIIINDFENLTNVAKKSVEKLMEAGLHVLVEYGPKSVELIKNLKVNEPNKQNILYYSTLTDILDLLEKNKTDGIEQNNVKGYAIILNGKEDIKVIEKIKDLNPQPLFFILKSDNIYEHVLVTRRLNEILHTLNIDIPYIHYANIDSNIYDDILVNSTVYVGTCLIDLMGDGLIVNVTDNNITAKKEQNEQIKTRVALNSFLTLNILQDTRIRLFKTDYISCPSCGRTLFNIQETTKKIMKLTGHLKGVKIAVMGCIVNGIGEMADAHFGYVGSGPKKIDLYYGKELVHRNIPEEEACDRLIELIKKHNKWEDP